jgi:hypothetical protein
MVTNDRWAGRPAPPGPGRRPARPGRLNPGAVLRSLLLGISVFALAALTGVLLSGAAPAVPAEAPATVPTGQAAPAPPVGPEPEQLFAYSMVYSGTAGLVLSAAGLIMVGQRRRLW